MAYRPFPNNPTRYRPRKGSWQGLVLLVVLAVAWPAIASVYGAAVENSSAVAVGAVSLVLAFGTVAVVSRILGNRAERAAVAARRAELIAQYGDEGIADAIMARRFWQGQTADMVRDSLGEPSAVDSKVLKRNTTLTWKYHPTGRNRYGLRIVIENGVVIGWDNKGG